MRADKNVPYPTLFMTTITADYLRQHAQNEITQDILDVVTSASPSGINWDKFNLAQLAKIYSVPLEVLEKVARDVTERVLQQDLDEDDYREAVHRMKQVEAIRDPGYRAWKLQNLAREYKRTPRQLTEIYNKALIADIQTKPVSVADFYSQSQKQVDWLIQGWIPKGSTVLLHGDGGAGKTLLIYQMIENILHGTDWQGYKTEPGPCLLIQSDEPHLVTMDRLQIRGITPDDRLHILSGWQADGMEKLEAHIQDLKPSFVLVDSNTAINRHTIVSENDTEYARPILQFADLATRYGCTFVIIHHSNAMGESRGTRAIHNSVSEVWGLSVAADNPLERVLRVQKTRLGRPPGRYKFAFSENDFSFEYLGEDRGDGEVEDNSGFESRILQWLLDAAQKNTAYAAAEVAEFLNINLNTARRCLRELWAKGLIHSRRQDGTRCNLYQAKNISVASDQRSDQPSDQSDQPSDQPDYSTDQRIKNPPICNENVTKNAPKDYPTDQRKTRRSLDQLPSNPVAAGIYPTSDQTSDQLINQNEKNQSRKNARSVDQLITYQSGDTVVPLGTANWIRSGSDKLPFQFLPRSLKEAKEIPLDAMAGELFHQIQTPSRVIAVKSVVIANREELLVKVRSTETGRNSVFRDCDLALLKKGGES